MKYIVKGHGAFNNQSNPVDGLNNAGNWHLSNEIETELSTHSF